MSSIPKSVVKLSTSLTEDSLKQIEVNLLMGMDLRSSCFVAGVNPIAVENMLKGAYANPDSEQGALLAHFRSMVANFEAKQLMELNLTHVSGRAAEYKQVLKARTTLPDGSVREDFDYVKVKDEIKPDPKVAQWLLSRRFRAKWGDQLDVHVTKDVMDESPERLVDVTLSSKESRKQIMKSIIESLDDEDE